MKRFQVSHFQKPRMKRILASALTLCLLLSVIPFGGITAFAQSEHTHREQGLCDCGGVVINETNFPDALFCSYVNTLEGAEDGFFTDAELQAITDIDIERSDAYKNVESLEGVAFFRNLMELRCRNRQITALDVSQLPLLESLQCSNNRLTALDVTQNTKLSVLLCNDNPIGVLDVTNNPELTNLTCSDNQLDVLDLRQNGKLKSLNCAGNRLAVLDLSCNPELMYLTCNKNQLTQLDLSYNPKLAELKCQSNLLTALDVQENTELTTLYCQSNFLTALNVTKNTQLQELNCSSNTLTALDVTKNTALKSLNCSYTQLQMLDVTKNTQLVKLYCDNNQLQALDVTQNTLLTELRCFSNKLTALDIHSNTALTLLDCSANELKALDLSSNTALTYLDCDRNHITSLDLSANGDIEDFAGSGQTESIAIDQQTMSFDMATLPGAFQGENATVITAGNSLSGNVLTVKKGGDKVSYTYNTGLEGMALEVLLTVTNPHAHTSVDDGDCTTAVYCQCGREMVEAQPSHVSTGDNVATYYKKPICDVCSKEYGEKLVDSTKPTLEIREGTALLNKAPNEIAFTLFAKEQKTVTVLSADQGMGVDKTYYFVSHEILSQEELESISWMEYTQPITLNPDSKNVIYAYAVDLAGNKSDICGSVGIVLDKTAPVFSGIENGVDIYGDAQFAVIEENLDSVTLDGQPITAQDGKYTIPADSKPHTVVATDKSGNTATCQLTVITVAQTQPPKTGDHTHVWAVTVVMILSGLCLVGTVDFQKRRKQVK